MLVFSRKLGEEIVIDGDIRVRVVDVSGNRVKLAFEAPRAVPIRRSEIPPPERSPQVEEFTMILVGDEPE